jgi:hypothetical protein
MDIAEICDRLNQRARDLAPDLLPNGRRAGNRWMFSGLDDHGRSESAYVILAGSKCGKWFDYGNAGAGEDKGDMLDLLRHKRCGGDQAAAIAEAKRELGIEERWTPGARIDPEEKARRAEAARLRAAKREEDEAAEYDRKARGAKRLYLQGRPIAGTPAERYLLGRSLSPDPVGDWPGSLRFFELVYHGALETKLPAMLAGIFTGQGRQIGTHRIFLSRRGEGWGKLTSAPAKMVLGNMWGGFVPIHKGRSGASMRSMAEGEAVYVTEGIEDAIAVRMVKPEARIVAAISLANIGAIVLPREAGKLVVVADRDDNAQAREQLERSIAQQQARGLEVALVMPPAGIKDMNDWLRTQGEAA